MSTDEHRHTRQELIAHLGRRDWSFPNESGGRDLYALHPYPAKFIHQIPRAIIKDLDVASDGIVCDPFCGCGTSLIVAQELGYESIGIDLNPIACLISRVATSPRPAGLEKALSKCIQHAKTIRNPPIPDIPNIDHWFEKPIQRAISAIITAIENEQSEQLQDCLRLALSSIIVRVSKQDSDTRYAAVEKDVTPRDVFDYFQRACERYLTVLHSEVASLPKSTIIQRDILDVTAEDFPKNIGLVVCSPPYPNAYEYWLYHKYRMWWLGYDPLMVKEREFGARPHFFKKNPQTPDDFRKQIESVFFLLAEVCLPESYACFVLGDSKIHGEIINNTELLCTAAKPNRFEPFAIISRDILLTRKAFNLAHSQRRKENIVVFQKRRVRPRSPACTATLKWHDYNYYPYEKRFALRELSAIPGIRRISIGPEGASISLPLRSINKLKKLVYFSEYSTSSGQRGFTLQTELENGSGQNCSQKRQSTRYGVHGLHEYKGKFNPQIVRGILNAYSLKPWAKIIDPFCGSGTTLVESLIAGYQAVGLDKNPFAVYLSLAKIAALRTSPDLMKAIAEKVVTAYQIGDCDIPESNEPRENYLKKWFPLENFKAIEQLRVIIEREAGELAPFFLIVLSDLLRDYSLQEPSDLRIRRRKSSLPKEKLNNRFEREVMKKIERVEDGFDAHGPITSNAEAYIADSRDWDEVTSFGIEKEMFDFALTSPPYATALPYIDTQRLSLIWLDILDPSSIREAEETLIGSREASKAELLQLDDKLSSNTDGLPPHIWEYCKLLQSHINEQDGFRRRAVPTLLYRYFTDMMHTFGTVQHALKNQGIYALIVGTNRTTLGGTQFNINTPQLLTELAQHQGWTVLELVPLETYKRYGLHAANAIQDETLLVLKNE